MYVADIQDIAEVDELLTEATALLREVPWSEQVRWDIEDLLRRRQQLLSK